MVIVSSDVTSPDAVPFIVADHMVNNSDGSVSFALDAAETKFAGQEPNVYYKRNDGANNAYQRFTLQGALVTSLTRAGDTMFTYTVAFGKNY